MTPKEYLRQAYRLNERINSHIEELENLRSLSTRIQGVSYGEHIHSPNRPTDAPFTKVLFKIMRELTAQGISIVYISHRLEEIMEIGDHVTILRDGKYVDNQSWEEIGVLLNASVRTVHRIHSAALHHFSVPK